METSATVRRMPSAGPHQNPNSYTAPCECCGQNIIVECYAKDPTDDKLMKIATEQCQCDGAKRKRVMERAKTKIPEYFGRGCSPIYGNPVDEKTEAWLLEGALLLATEKIDSVTIKLNDSEVATLKGGHETVDVKRRRIKEYKGRI